MKTLHPETSGEILQGRTYGHDAGVPNAQECVQPHSNICMFIAWKYSFTHKFKSGTSGVPVSLQQLLCKSTVSCGKWPRLAYVRKAEESCI